MQPYLVEAAFNSAGDEVYRRAPVDTANARRVVDEGIARDMTSLMGAVVIRGTGHGGAARGP